jgi:drug/metabolite transporter (DMT)-like permease
MTALIIFAGTFVLVFGIGFQSLNAINGQYIAAVLSSIAVSISNLILFKTLPQATPFEVVAYVIAGPIAIVCSMWVHKRWFTKCPAATTAHLRKGCKRSEAPQSMEPPAK